MFREYLKRLESNKICQNLNMQSFLLLPMQRITRLPLLILAILNRTPLDYPDQGLVESTLRNVQKVRKECPVRSSGHSYCNSGVAREYLREKKMCVCLKWKRVICREIDTEKTILLLCTVGNEMEIYYCSTTDL